MTDQPGGSWGWVRVPSDDPALPDEWRPEDEPVQDDADPWDDAPDEDAPEAVGWRPRRQRGYAMPPLVWPRHRQQYGDIGRD